MGERLDLTCILSLQHTQVYDEADCEEEGRECCKEQQRCRDAEVEEQQSCGAEEDGIEQGAQQNGGHGVVPLVHHVLIQNACDRTDHVPDYTKDEPQLHGTQLGF